MTNKEFDRITRARALEVLERLARKGREYTRGADRLHNHKVRARELGLTPATVCLTDLTKHTRSIVDMVGDGREYPPEVWAEKVGDAVAYLLILEAIALEDER